MDVKLYRLKNKNSNSYDKEDDSLLEEINNYLFDQDIYLKEDCSSYAPTIFFIESGGVEKEFTKLIKNVKVFPVIILSSNRNNSLAACLEIYTYCLSVINIPAVMCFDTVTLASGLIQIICEVAEAYEKLQNNNLGVIIGEADWLISSHVDYSYIKKKFNINMIKIGKAELLSEINKKNIGKPPHLSALYKKCSDKVELQQALYVYGALKRLVKKYKLDGLTIKCFDLLNINKSTACLALSLLNDEGITAGCEGDVPALLTMHFANAISSRTSFMANPSYFNKEKNNVIFAHCSCPLNMLKEYSFTTHFESGLGVAIKGQFNHGQVSVLKIIPSLDNCIALTGEVRSDCSKKEFCRTQVMVNFDESDFRYFSVNPFGNHVILVYGDITRKFSALVNMYTIFEKKNSLD